MRGGGGRGARGPRPPPPFGYRNVCVGLQDRGTVNSRMCLFIVEVLVIDLEWSPGLLSGSYDSLWRPRVMIALISGS